MGLKHGSILEKTISKIAEFLDNLNISPTTLTLLGILITLVSSMFFATGTFRIAGFLLLLGGLFDVLDGSLARISGKDSKWGAFIDSITDRYSDLLPLIGIIVFYAVSHNIMFIFVSALTLLGTIMISYTKARAEALGIKCEIGLMQRAQRVVLLGIGSFLGLLGLTLLILVVATNFTVLQRIRYVYQNTIKRLG